MNLRACSITMVTLGSADCICRPLGISFGGVGLIRIYLEFWEYTRLPRVEGGAFAFGLATDRSWQLFTQNSPGSIVRKLRMLFDLVSWLSAATGVATLYVVCALSR